MITGAWSEQDNLALCGEDRVLTVSNEEGDTLCQSPLKGDATLVQFGTLTPDDGRSAQKLTENCVSVVVNKKNLLLLLISDPENPYTLAFQERYGIIVDYQWYGDSYILIAFSGGLIIVIGTNLRDLGQEIQQIRAHKESLNNISICSSAKRIATASENM